MSAGTMELSVIVRLRDLLSGGLNTIQKELKSMHTLAQRIGSGLNNLGQRLAGFGLAGSVGLAAGVKSAADFDASLRDSAIIMGLHGKAAEDWIKKTGGSYQAMSKQIGQTSLSLADSLHDMLNANIEATAADKMVAQIGRVATASGAAMNDLTNTAKVLFQNWEIPAEKMELALAKLHTAGKLGSFELKDMAQFLPKLAPAMAVLGIKGDEAINSAGAFLQVSRMGASSGEQAATNFGQFLQDITSPHFKMRMAKKGVDMDKLLLSAAEKGINPIDAVVEKINKLTNAKNIVDKALGEAKLKGLSDEKTNDLVRSRMEAALKASGLGDLIVNQESRIFLATLLAHLKENSAIKQGIASATTDVVATDFDTRMNGLSQKLLALGEAFDQFARRFGTAMEPLITGVTSIMTGINKAIAWLDEKGFTPLINQMIRLGAAITIASGALGTLSLVGKVAGGGAAVAAAGGAAATEAAAAAGGAVVAQKVAPKMLGRFIPYLGAGLVAYDVGSWIYEEVNKGAEFDRLHPETLNKLDKDLKENKRDYTGQSLSQQKDSLERQSSATDEDGLTASDRLRLNQARARRQKEFNRDRQSDGVNVSGQITIKVDGPGTVTSATSSNPNVTLQPDRGDMLNGLW